MTAGSKTEELKERIDAYLSNPIMPGEIEIVEEVRGHRRHFLKASRRKHLIELFLRTSKYKGLKFVPDELLPANFTFTSKKVGIELVTDTIKAVTEAINSRIEEIEV